MPFGIDERPLALTVLLNCRQDMLDRHNQLRRAHGPALDVLAAAAAARSVLRVDPGEEGPVDQPPESWVGHLDLNRAVKVKDVCDVVGEPQVLELHAGHCVVGPRAV